MKVQCPECKWVKEITDGVKGQKGRCPACNNVFELCSYDEQQGSSLPLWVVLLLTINAAMLLTALATYTIRPHIAKKAEEAINTNEEQRRELRGRDLRAWKLARESLRKYRQRGNWLRSEISGKPTYAYMVRTSTGDYEFAFLTSVKPIKEQQPEDDSPKIVFVTVVDMGTELRVRTHGRHSMVSRNTPSYSSLWISEEERGEIEQEIAREKLTTDSDQ